MKRFLLMIPALPLLFAMAACAQGGPPFRTDDPETPGNKHLEINFGFIGDRHPGNGAYQVPDFDFNYGLGDRIQLKYELPIALEETRPQPASPDQQPVPGQVIGGLGESLLGVKWRFYEHHDGDARLRNRFGTGLLSVFGHRSGPDPFPPSAASAGPADTERRVNLSISTYPQLFLDNSTRAVPRGLVAPGPSFYLPLEISARLGPLRLDAEAGYNFGNRNVPQSWSRGLLVGHEFTDRTEAYLELYDQQDANRVAAGRGIGQFAASASKQREFTLGLGGRQALNRHKTLNLLLMGGRSLQAIALTNNQPSWIAYVGLQVLLGPREPVTAQVEQKKPDESKP